MAALRRFIASDLDALYTIASANAPDIYDDKRLIGSLYSAPYAIVSPDTVLVAEDSEGVGGYIVGTNDTLAFEQRLERDWWPALRRAFPAPAGEPSAWSADQRRHNAFHSPRRTPDAIVESYPAHVHLQLLPRLQGQGLGRALFAAWRDAAGRLPIHVGVNAGNGRATTFWTAQGFVRLEVAAASSPNTVWLGLQKSAA